MVYATDGQKAAAGQLPGNVNLGKRPEPTNMQPSLGQIPKARTLNFV